MPASVDRYAGLDVDLNPFSTTEAERLAALQARAIWRLSMILVAGTTCFVAMSRWRRHARVSV